MGIKKRIMTSGTKFVKKHQSLYEKLAKEADGSLATDDEASLPVSLISMTLASADGNIVATIVARGDLEQDDTFTVYQDGVSKVDTPAGIAGIPGEDTFTLTWAHDDLVGGTEVEVRVVLDRTGAELSGTVETAV